MSLTAAASAPVSPARSPAPPAVPAASPAHGDPVRRTLSEEELAKARDKLNKTA